MEDISGNSGRTRPRTEAARAPRVTGWLALAGVSLIAGIASYFHALAVVQAAGATAPVAYLVPALADLVILGASAALLDASRRKRPRPRLATFSLAVGIVVTVAMNIAASKPHAMPAWLVDAWPAVAFTLSLESLVGLVRRVPRADQLAESPAEPETALYRLFDADGRLLYAGITWDVDDRMRDHRREKPWWPEVARTEIEWFASRTQAALAEYAAITEEGPLYNKAIRNQEPTGRVAKTVIEAARAAYAASLKSGTPISERALASQFGISRRRAGLIRAEVAQENVVQAALPAAPGLTGLAQEPSLNGSGPHA